MGKTVARRGSWMLSLTVLILSCLFTPRGGTVSALPSAHMEAHVAIPKRGAAALLKSKMFHEMKRQGKDPVIDSGDLTMLKERLMARLSGKTLVETKLFWKNRNEKYEEVAVVGSWGQWMALHELDKVPPHTCGMHCPVLTYHMVVLVPGQQ